MGDPTLFRGRLNGASVEDADDTASPSGERGAIVTVIREDSDATGGGVHVQAKVFLPNGIPCPLYAANLHFFGRCDGPASVPLDIDAQPHVIVRRDMSVPGGTTCCWNIVCSPTFVARAEYKWASGSYEPAYQGDLVNLTFYGAVGSRATDALGYNVVDSATSTNDIIQPNSPVIVTARVDAGPSFPSGYSRAWTCAPLASQPIPCKVTGGSGVNTICSMYARDLVTPTETGVAVTQLYVVGDIPTDAWAFASRINGVWYMQVPIWVV